MCGCRREGAAVPSLSSSRVPPAIETPMGTIANPCVGIFAMLTPRSRALSDPAAAAPPPERPASQMSPQKEPREWERNGKPE